MNINKHNVILEISAGRTDQLISSSLPQIAFSGRSNVGKSSLVNRLLSRKSLARVSSEPGKTITVNYYKVDNKLYLVDLPGYGYAKRFGEDKKKWSALVESFFSLAENMRTVKLVFQLIDIKSGPTGDDNMMLDWLEHTGIPYCVVATKCDKLNKTELRANLEALATHPCIGKDVSIIPFSSQTGEGTDKLWASILAAL